MAESRNPAAAYAHALNITRFRCGWVAAALALWLSFAPSSRGAPLAATCDRQAFQALITRGADQNVPLASREAALEKAAGLCPLDPLPYHSLGALSLQAGDIGQSLLWIRKGLESDPHDPILGCDLGAALLAAGKPEQALKPLERLPPSARVEFYLGMANRALRRHKTAREALARSYALGDKDPYVLYALIEQDKALHDTQAGLNDFQTLARDFPDSAWLHLLLGNAYQSRQDSAGAVEEYQKAASLDPRLPIVHFQLGRIAFDRAQFQEAIADFHREVDLDPSFGEAYLYLGASLHRTGKNREAIPFLEEAVARDPNDPLAYSTLAGAQVEADDAQAALKTLAEGESRFPDEASFPAQLARLMKTLGNPQEAAHQAALAEALNRKNNPQIQTASGASNATGLSENTEQFKALAQCINAGDAECASAELARLDSPGLQQNTEFLNLKAEALNLMRKRSQALTAIQKAIKSDPGKPAYFITQGRIEQRLGNQEAAIQSFLRAEQLHPGDARPVYDIGMSFFLMGDAANESSYYQRAAQHFKTALEIEPRDDKAEFMLGAVNVIEFKMDDAKMNFERAIAMNPQNPYYHLHYGILLSRMGDSAGALREMKLAEKLDPSYARTYFSLGEVLEQDRNYKDAKIALETGLRLEPDFAQAYYTLGRVDLRLGLRSESEAALEKFALLKNKSHDPDADPMNAAVTSAESKSKASGPQR